MSTLKTGTEIVFSPVERTRRRMCTITGKVYEVSVKLEDYNRWKDGELIQNVFPDLSVEQREFLITGITPAEWDNMMPEDKDV